MLLQPKQYFSNAVNPANATSPADIWNWLNDFGYPKFGIDEVRPLWELYSEDMWAECSVEVNYETLSHFKAWLEAQTEDFEMPKPAETKKSKGKNTMKNLDLNDSILNPDNTPWEKSSSNGQTKATTNCSIGDFGDFPMFGRQGWICPKCGAVLSPDTPFCYFCSPTKQNQVYTTRTPYDPNSTGSNPNQFQGFTITFSTTTSEVNKQ